MSELDEAVLRKAAHMVQEADARVQWALARMDNSDRAIDVLTEALRKIAVKTSDPWAMGTADSALEVARSYK